MNQSQNETSMTTSLDRSTAPPAGPAPEITLPSAQSHTLDNGLKIRLVEYHEVPMVRMRMLVHTGAAADPLETPGLARMTAQMLDEGTAQRTALEIASDLDYLGANLNTGVTWDYSYLNLTTLRKHLEDALDVYTDVVLNPTFLEEEFDRVQTQQLNSILQKQDNPSTLATEAFYRVIYTDGHPYGSSADGTESSVKSMTPDMLQEFWSDNYRPNNATLVVVGDLTMDELLNEIEPELGSWEQGPGSFPEVEDIPDVEYQNIYVVDRPGAPQSQIRIGHPGLYRNSPDYASVQVMNEILGGSFSSRINLNLREDKGYTYAARSQFVYREGKGPFLAFAGVVTNATDSSVVEFLKEINGIIEAPVSEAELERAKSSMTLSLARETETPAQIMNMVVDQIVYDLPESYLNQFVQKVRETTAQQVQQAAEEYLHPDNMAIVIVGDIATIREGLARLDYGNIIELDSQGNRVSS